MGMEAPALSWLVGVTSSSGTSTKLALAGDGSLDLGAVDVLGCSSPAASIDLQGSSAAAGMNSSFMSASVCNKQKGTSTCMQTYTQM